MNCTCGYQAAGNYCGKCGSRILPDYEMPTGSLILKGRYKISQKICETAFSRVYQAIEIPTCIFVAAKEHKIDPQAKPIQNLEDALQFKREVSFLKKINSPYIVQYLDSGTENGRLYLITEFISGINLKSYKLIYGPLDENTAIKFSKDITLGLIAIQEAGIISRDIKPLNLIYNGAYIVHIDLGIAKRIGQNTSRSIKNCFTPFFAAPEHRMGIGSFETSDIYSTCATIVWLMANPQLDENQIATFLNMNSGAPIMTEALQRICRNISMKFAGILAKGMHPDHRKRWDTARTFYNELCSI